MAAPLVTELRLEGGDEVLVVRGLDGEASYRDQHNLELVRFKVRFKMVKSLFRYGFKNVCS